MIGIDTNVLVYAHRAGAPEHAGARAHLERAAADPRGCGLPLFCIAEFWSVVTHQRVGRPSTPRVAHQFVEALIASAEMAVWAPDPSFAGRLTALAADRGIEGARVFDLQIALLAREGGATEMWSYDARFVKIAGLKMVTLR